MEPKFREGDKVRWEYHSGGAEGIIEEVVVEPGAVLVHHVMPTFGYVVSFDEPHLCEYREDLCMQEGKHTHRALLLGELVLEAAR